MIVKVNNSEFNAKQMNLITEKRFSEILQFLVDKEGQATLREFKKKFPQFDITDEYVDDLVVNHLIVRHHGRYNVYQNIVTNEMQLNIKKKCDTFFDEHQKKIEEVFKEINSDESFFKVLYLLSDIESSNKVAYYEESTLSKEWLKLPTKISKIVGKRSTFISLGGFYPIYNHHITDYFDFLSKKQTNLPEKFVELRDLIGDINPSYFIRYAERKMRRLSRGKELSTDKADIFMEALCKMDYVTNNAENYQLNVLAVDISSEDMDINSFFKSIKNQVSIYQLDNDELEFLIRVIFINWLLDNELIKLPISLHGYI